MALIIALVTGRCSYSIEDGGYDLSRFREDPGLTTLPDDLRGIVLTNAEAIQAISARDGGRELRFVVIGDTISDQNRTFRALLQDIAALDPPPAFIVHLGDRVVAPVVDFYGTYLKVIRDAPCPVLHVDGNHDVREEGERISRAFFGDRDFYMDKDGLRFVFMGNVRKDRRSGFTREQLAWLEDALKAPAPSRKFVFAHVPPKAPFKRFHRGIYSLFTPRLENEAEFLAILARHNVVAAAFGHRHVHASAVHNGVLMIITGGGGQRNFLEPRVRQPRFTKKNHYTLVDIPRSGFFEEFEGTLTCMGKGNETLSATSFTQASPFASGGDSSVTLRPYPTPGGGSFRPGDPAGLRLGSPSRAAR